LKLRHVKLGGKLKGQLWVPREAIITVAMQERCNVFLTMVKFNPKDSLFCDSGSDEESTDKMSDDESYGELTV